MRQCTSENLRLQKKVENLESENRYKILLCTRVAPDCRFFSEVNTCMNITVEPRIRDTLGLIVLSLVERLSLSRRQRSAATSGRSSLSQRVPYRRFHCIYFRTQYILERMKPTVLYMFANFCYVYCCLQEFDYSTEEVPGSGCRLWEWQTHH